MNVLPRSTVALALSALGLAAARPGRFCVVTGHSMSPTLHHGQVVWVDAIDPDRADPRRGEIVLFRWQDRVYVKRVYATEGDRVVMLSDVGDAQPFLMPVRPGAEAWVASAVRRYRGRFRFQRLKVPPATFYALGDCPTNSIDSRSLGPIPVRAIIGRVRPLLGHFRRVDLALSPLRPQRSGLRAAPSASLRARRSASDTPRMRRRGPWRPPP